MSKTIFTSLSPNEQPDDVRLAFAALLCPWTWQNKKNVRALEQGFCSLLPIKHGIAFESGRTALWQVLQAMGVKAGDEVMMQAFTCVAVANAIRWSGATPVYVDCEHDSFNMDIEDAERKVSPNIKALIVQHTFGVPADMDKVMEFAKKHKLQVVEDCAHAIGSRYRGRMVGTFGAAAIFSFGRDKALSSVFGGLAVTNDDALAQKLRAYQTASPQSGYWWTCRQLFHPIVTQISKKFYTRFSLGKALMYAVKRLHLISRAVEPQERRGEKATFVGRRMSGALAVLASHQLAKLPEFIAHRARLVRFYQELFKDKNIEFQSSPDDSESVRIRFTIKVSAAAKIRQSAKTAGMYLGDWYDTVIAPRGVIDETIGYAAGSCPIAESLTKAVVNLPTDINTTPADAERIAEFIKSRL